MCEYVYITAVDAQLRVVGVGGDTRETGERRQEWAGGVKNGHTDINQIAIQFEVDCKFASRPLS